jgi:hypothetical protein
MPHAECTTVPAEDTKAEIDQPLTRYVPTALRLGGHRCMESP